VKDFPIKVPATADFSHVGGAVERCCKDLGLTKTMRDTLGKYPGCVHWHYKKPKESGTLEITSWPSQRRLWITVQAGRRAPWIDEAVPELSRMLRSAIASAG
jgi:hypothetical protein